MGSITSAGAKALNLHNITTTTTTTTTINNNNDNNNNNINNNININNNNNNSVLSACYASVVLPFVVPTLVSDRLDRQARNIVTESGGEHPLGLKATVYLSRAL